MMGDYNGTPGVVMFFRGAPVAGSAFSNYAGGMEAGPSKLEEFIPEARERFARIETRLDQTVTKADLAEAIGSARFEISGLRGQIGNEISALRSEMHKEFTGMVKWIVGTAVVLGAAAITVITFVLNYATPPRILPAPTAQLVPAPQTPLIIQMPPYPTSPPRQ
ncbi:MAG: hypothetical protein QFF03_13855 [Pseudomonadota bacterium]|nr:hypothetical protein [Pseudomonadota bacterium]